MQPQGGFSTDFDGMDGIDPPADDLNRDFVGLQIDRIDPTAQSLGHAFDLSTSAIANVNTPNSGGTAGVAPDGRIDLV
jgi:hypothetical protein